MWVFVGSQRNITMLEHNGVECWLTTSEQTALPLILTSTGETDVVTCTVQLENRRSYIVHWMSKSPLTAWCELHTKSPVGKTSRGAAKCEMDAVKPATQKRNSAECTSSGRNLGFYGRRIASTSLGMAWLEIRRATAIQLVEVTKAVYLL
ncbi:hypothetical protein K439DRAFT_1022247 [Ramaria rubella]|nr:hypothetical protein K439DRAFT_1022247 [Ramaria rubella]